MGKLKRFEVLFALPYPLILGAVKHQVGSRSHVQVTIPYTAKTCVHWCWAVEAPWHESRPVLKRWGWGRPWNAALGNFTSSRTVGPHGSGRWWQLLNRHGGAFLYQGHLRRQEPLPGSSKNATDLRPLQQGQP